MPGAQVRIDLQLPDRMLTLEGTVAFANVPGNLQRPNLPLGMGVRFTGSDPGERSALVDYVESRLRQLSV
jgi:hypothetical protein